MISNLLSRIKRKWRHNPFLMADAVAQEENLVSCGWPRDEAHRVAMESYDAIVNARKPFLMVDCQCRKMNLIASGVPPEEAYRLAMREYRLIAGTRN